MGKRERESRVYLPGMSVPHTNCCVQPSRRDDVAVKRDSVYLAKMSAENLQTRACVDIPELDPPISAVKTET